MTKTQGRPVSSSEIEQWIADTLIQQMNVDPTQVEPGKRLVEYGIDSLQMISLVGQLEDRLGCRFTSNPLVLHPSSAALAELIAGRLAAGETEINPAQG